MKIKVFVAGLIILAGILFAPAAWALSDDDVVRVMGAAYEAAQNKDYEEALRLYKSLLDVRPESADLTFNVGVCFGLLGRHLEAIYYYQKYLELTDNPDDKEIARKLIAANERELEEGTTVNVADPKSITVSPRLPALQQPQFEAAIQYVAPNVKGSNLDLGNGPGLRFGYRWTQSADHALRFELKTRRWEVEDGFYNIGLDQYSYSVQYLAYVGDLHPSARTYMGFGFGFAQERLGGDVAGLPISSRESYPSLEFIYGAEFKNDTFGELGFSYLFGSGDSRLLDSEMTLGTGYRF